MYHTALNGRHVGHLQGLECVPYSMASIFILCVCVCANTRVYTHILYIIYIYNGNRKHEFHK